MTGKEHGHATGLVFWEEGWDSRSVKIHTDKKYIFLCTRSVIGRINAWYHRDRKFECSPKTIFQNSFLFKLHTTLLWFFM